MSAQNDNARPPRVVIVGAGFGGLTAARALCGRGVDVTLVDQQNHHLFQPLLYQVATAGLSPADIAAPIRSIVKHHKSTRVLLDRVIGIDKHARTVSLAEGDDLPYDYLILATGARHSYFGKEHWAAHAPGIKTIDDATAVRHKILIALEHGETARDKATRDRFLTFVVIGGGPTGVEMAGAIAELTRHTVGMDFRHITPHCAKVILIEAGSRLLAAFPPELSAAAQLSLERLGCEVRLNSRVQQVSEAGVVVNDVEIPSAAVVWAAGVRASPAARWLDIPADTRGRAIVDANLEAPGVENVFVIGDTAAATDGDSRPIPGIAPAAKQMGEHVARVIAARVAARTPPRPFRYRHAGNLATIGRQRAVIEFGPIRLQGLIAWLLWSTAHVYFLVGFRNRAVVGANWLWNYLTFDRGARLITGVVVDDPGLAAPDRAREAV